MFNKPIDQITNEDIEFLVSNEIPEGKHIEYKQNLPGNSDGERKEFLADTSSFANAGGGYIFYGIEEKRDEDGQATGLPKIARGLKGINADTEISRLESLINSGIEPRIPGIHSKAINGNPNPVIIIQIPKSWASPHMVVFKKTSRFYSRTSNGKYQMDISELRSAFLQSEEMFQKVNRFRQDRIDSIVSELGSIADGLRPTIVMHLVPMGFDDPNQRVDVAGNEEILKQLKLTFKHNGNPRFNFHGYFIPALGSGSQDSSYLQFFRSGAIEITDNNLISKGNGQKLIPSILFANEMTSLVRNQIDVIKALNINPPVFLFVSLLFVKGYSMAVHAWDNDTSEQLIFFPN